MNETRFGAPPVLVGAPTSIGIRPYEDGTPRRLDRAPGVLRALGIGARLRADDLGDVPTPPYVDFERAPATIRNEEAVGEFSEVLAGRVEAAVDTGRPTIVLGGDCSIVLGCLLGATRSAGRLGLVYVDGHADFETPEESVTGSAAGMCLAMVVGRGDSRLTALMPSQSLVRPEHVVLIGRRDGGQEKHGHRALAASPILDIPGPVLEADGPGAVVARTLDRLADAGLDGFWIHLDADVLNPAVMPAVDSPEPGGPDTATVAALIRPLARHPLAVGLQLTIYDPQLDDVELTCGKVLMDLVSRIYQSD